MELSRCTLIAYTHTIEMSEGPRRPARCASRPQNRIHDRAEQAIHSVNHQSAWWVFRPPSTKASGAGRVQKRKRVGVWTASAEAGIWIAHSEQDAARCFFSLCDTGTVGVVSLFASGHPAKAQGRNSDPLPRQYRSTRRLASHPRPESSGCRNEPPVASASAFHAAPAGLRIRRARSASPPFPTSSPLASD